MSDLFKKAISLGLGLTVVSKEKIEKTVDDLVKRGKLAPGESRDLVDKLMERGNEEQGQIKKWINEQVQRALVDVGVPTKDEVARLEQRIEALEAQLAELGRSPLTEPVAAPAPLEVPPLKGNENE